MKIPFTYPVNCTFQVYLEFLFLQDIFALCGNLSFIQECAFLQHSNSLISVSLLNNIKHYLDLAYISFSIFSDKIYHIYKNVYMTLKSCVIMFLSIKKKKKKQALARWLSQQELHPMHQKVTGQIVSQDTYLDCGFNSQSGIHGRQLMDVSLAFFSSFSLKINNNILG